ncbi:MAG: aspartate aminotransferase, partial [Gemmatimonadetes bacterium]|nr:aspartate aminotransferase [Actinomycetota bacterium]NIY12637.1 aspartate aminotransferase [Gemmatimonadota bacterium]NIU71037.1 aspartate aminotransferase [Actinomycetota bacterium]NIV58963.1 aspartate aminotransferase [Actinomycetota bacterium]NIV90539.1 aspartate aminotransferase [Actinomycetota bacterium]
VLGSEGQHYLRLSTANADEELVEAVSRMEEASQDVSGFEDFVHSGVRLTL